MLRMFLNRPRTSRLVSITCLLSLFVNFLLLVSKHNVNNVNNSQQKLANTRGGHGFGLHQLSGVNLSVAELDDQPIAETASAQKEEQLLVKATDTSHVINCTLCPFYPPGLLGPLSGMAKEVQPESLKIIFKDMKNGRTRPVDCMVREKIAIVIPYRNRYPHLHILLHNLIPFLERQQADATIFVIEQGLPGTFNRGALLNVGFMEANKIATFDCFIFHDVDLIPLDDRHLYRCGDNPKHLAVAMNKYNFRLPYRNYFGGAVAFSYRQYQDMNGCSNIYFGWGGEDDEMYQRVVNSGYIVTRFPANIARYDMIKHTRDKGNEPNPIRKIMLSTARKRQWLEGLNTLKYKVQDVRVDQLYNWITVTFNQTEIIKSAPSYVWQALADANKKVNAAPQINITTTSTTTSTSRSTTTSTSRSTTTSTMTSTTESKSGASVQTSVTKPNISSIVSANGTSWP